MAKASKALRGRMRSVQNTRKITRTMELVSTSKLKRAQDKVVAARPYASALADVLADLVNPELAERFPLLRRPAPPAKGGPRRAAVMLITSNRGLCGGFNANLIKEARGRIEALERAGYEAELHLVGRKGIGFFRYIGRTIATQRMDIGDKPTARHAIELVERLIEDFAAGTLASLDVVCARFVSPISTPPTTLGVLPVSTPAAKQGGLRADYILKPGADEILSELLPLYVRNQVYRGLVETAAAEHGARRTAMKNATDNAGEIYELLKRTYNRQRQGAITQEIAEIVGGAAALEG
ncbi:MAG: ATP synthase F1 subunit gamma, partial [Gemmatimonadota bacterium]|nr:ATP synthase F1 subunit gamma [Gemmatimonadota bacterium]MDH4349450.1 ATP synthase F1 subunit gamma [Gemmatimonadota bacterium]MDH5283715.1 ATP synthase F1 subunit gamma [Gemmatimonadota bacterium]